MLKTIAARNFIPYNCSKAIWDESMMVAPPDVIREMPHMQANVRFYDGLRKFYRRYGDRFCALWAGMHRSAREKLIQVVSIRYPRWKGDKNGGGEVGGSRGIALLLPDHNVRDLAHPKTGITRVLKRIANAEDIRQLYWEDSVHARNLLERGAFKRQFGPYTFTLIHGETPQTFEFPNPERDVEELAKFLDNFVAQGLAYDASVFGLITDMEYWSWRLIATVVDEIVTEVFGREARLVIGNITMCSKCGASPASKDKNLLRCSVCKSAAYCNAACQRAHWSVHKLECKNLTPL